MVRGFLDKVGSQNVQDYDAAILVGVEYGASMALPHKRARTLLRGLFPFEKAHLAPGGESFAVLLPGTRIYLVSNWDC